MPSLHNFWKLRASLRPSSGGYKADLLQAGRLKTVFEKGSSSSPRNTRPSFPLHSHSGSSLPPSPRHPSVSAFLSKLFSTSRGSTADHSPVTASPGNYAREKKALSATAALSRVISTPSIHGPLVQSCGGYPTSLDGGVHVAVSTTTSRLPQESWREHLNCEKSICKDHAICTAAEETQEEWKEQRLGPIENVTDLDASSKLSIISFEAKKELRILHSAKISNIVDEFTVRRKISGEGERLETGRVFERITIQGAQGIQNVFSQSIPFRFFHSGTTSPVVGKYASFARTNLSSLGLALDQNGEDEIPVGPKESRVESSSLQLLSGACCLPHPKKVKTGGDDAYFICSSEQVVGVADGVGGWADMGVDAGEYARELMTQSMIAVCQEPQGFIDPARVMARAHSKTKCRGSSTACILALSDYGLQAANLGDSGFLLMRNGRTVFKSPVQQHQFNIPFQLESGGSDPPSAAEVFSLPVAAGDVIVAGTDGLFDNVYDNELTGVVVRSTRAGHGPQLTAQKLVALARERAEDRNRQTPFSTAAQEAGFRFYGGKMDDITVIVSYITNSKSVPVTAKSLIPSL
ncbi:hypothetical protein BDL97_08G151000 [Sphagnum fallax]|nr:hypothetical protein BDL97_08G151000 [Sphagnum fallax]KAH8955636.1 hypothetical protein BDL97_08G151000 [Sphagnum fallax]